MWKYQLWNEFCGPSLFPEHLSSLLRCPLQPLRGSRILYRRGLRPEPSSGVGLAVAKVAMVTATVARVVKSFIVSDGAEMYDEERTMAYGWHQTSRQHLDSSMRAFIPTKYLVVPPVLSLLSALGAPAYNMITSQTRARCEI